MPLDFNNFKKEVERGNVRKIVNRNLLTGTPICFKGDTELIDRLSESLSRNFDVHIKDIEIVGSAKLGFSLDPEAIGVAYGSNSDIDMVIVSAHLFDEAWHEILKLDFDFYRLKARERAAINDCYKTISHGFVRPDKLPASTNFFKKWWSVFSKLSKDDDYEQRDIRGRLFKNWWFVERCYTLQIEQLKPKL